MARFQRRMLQMKSGRILVGFGKRQQLAFTVKLAQEGQADWGSGATRLKLAVPHNRLGSIISTKTVGQNNSWMSGKVCDHQLRAAGGRDNYIHLAENFIDLIYGHHASTAGLDVLHRRNKTGRAEGIGPV